MHVVTTGSCVIHRSPASLPLMSPTLHTTNRAGVMSVFVLCSWVSSLYIISPGKNCSLFFQDPILQTSTYSCCLLVTEVTRFWGSCLRSDRFHCFASSALIMCRALLALFSPVLYRQVLYPQAGLFFSDFLPLVLGTEPRTLLTPNIIYP